jgi:hypothetical protein
MINNTFEPFSLATIQEDIKKGNNILYILNHDPDNMFVLNDIINTFLSGKIKPIDITTIARRIIPKVKDKILWIYSRQPLTWQQAIEQKALLLKFTSDSSITVLLTHNISYPYLNWLYHNNELAGLEFARTMIFPNRTEYIQRTEVIYSKEDSNKQLYNIVIPALYSQINNIKKLEYIEEGRLESNKTKLSTWKLFFSKEGFSKYEIIKIDSIYKIKKEKYNYDMLESNYTSDILYHVSGVAEFREEFICAIRYSPTLNYDDHNLKLKTFKTLLKEESFYANHYYEKLSSHINKLYNIADGTYSKNDTFAYYVQSIFGWMIDMNISNINNITKVQIDNTKPLYNFDIQDALEKFEELRDKGIKAKIIEIDTLQKQLRLTLENNEGIVPIIKLHFNIDSEICKRYFHKIGLKEGESIFINGGICKGLMVTIEEQIKTIGRNISEPFESKTRPFSPDKQFLREHKSVDRIVDKPYIEIKNYNKEISYQVKNKHRIINDEYIEIVDEKIYNPLYLLNQYRIKNKKLYQDKFGIAHGDLNLDNIIISYDHQNKQKFEMRFIDIASFGFDYPLSFDYVKLETEIKTHILAFKLNAKPNLKLISTIKQFEYMLQKDSDDILLKNKNPQSIIIPLNISDDLKSFYKLLLNIRSDAYKRYNDPIAPTLYRQQLLFYNLKTLTYRALSTTARVWTLISASICAEILGK